MQRETLSSKPKTVANIEELERLIPLLEEAKEEETGIAVKKAVEQALAEERASVAAQVLCLAIKWCTNIHSRSILYYGHAVFSKVPLIATYAVYRPHPPQSDQKLRVMITDARLRVRLWTECCTYCTSAK